MKATILYISKSNKSAIVAVEQQFGAIMQSVSGFVKLPTDHGFELKQVLEIPATGVTKEVRMTKDGKAFDFLVFS